MPSRVGANGHGHAKARNPGFSKLVPVKGDKYQQDSVTGLARLCSSFDALRRREGIPWKKFPSEHAEAAFSFVAAQFLMCSRLLQNIIYEEVSDANVGELEKINLAIFPIKYPRQVYDDVVRCTGVSFLASIPLPVAAGRSESQTAGDGRGPCSKAIGGVSCRLEKAPDLGGPILYIITLGVLAPYRNSGLGTALLCRCLDTVREYLPEVVLARLHVQVSNTDAIRFYQKHGFKVVETIENYYLRTEPRHAVVLELPFAAADQELTF